MSMTIYLNFEPVCRGYFLESNYKKIFSQKRLFVSSQVYKVKL